MVSGDEGANGAGPTTPDPLLNHGNPFDNALGNEECPAASFSTKPLLRLMSETLIESPRELLRTWSVNNLPLLSQRVAGSSPWSSSPAVNNTQHDMETSAEPQPHEENKQDYEVTYEDPSSDEDIPLPDTKSLSFSRRSKTVSLNSKIHRSMTNLANFRTPKIRRKRDKRRSSVGPGPRDLSFEGAVDLNWDVLSSKDLIAQRYKDTSHLIYLEWKTIYKEESRLNADGHYQMSKNNCKQM